MGGYDDLIEEGDVPGLVAALRNEVQRGDGWCTVARQLQGELDRMDVDRRASIAGQWAIESDLRGRAELAERDRLRAVERWRSAYHSRNRHRAARKAAEREVERLRDASVETVAQRDAAWREVEEMKREVERHLSWLESNGRHESARQLRAAIAASREDQP